MRVHVCFIQNDLMNHETNVVCDGIGLLNDGALRYQEDGTKAIHLVTFKEEEIILERKADVCSRTVLKEKEDGECIVTSPYGVMHFTAKLQFRKQNEAEWKVHYILFSDTEPIAEMELEWKIKQLA
jgi:uncharacterized beta-barrel protein YwiB (DUF1934 family)